MKKKLMMVAVLLGALSLGACVDDNESASVTAIRNAKAAQLESLAKLASAQADAEAVRAAAEAALNNAKAAYQQAQADAKAEETEYNKQQHALKLEKLQAEYEAAIAKAKKEAALADQKAWENVDQHIQNVYSDYTLALGQIHTLNGELINKEFELAKADIDIEAAQAAYNRTVATYNQTIANKTAQIERLKSLNLDKAALETQLNTLAKNAYDLMKSQKPAAEKATKEAKEKAEDLYYPIDLNAYNEMTTDVNPTYVMEAHERLEWAANAPAYILAIDTLQQVEKAYKAYYASTTRATVAIVDELEVDLNAPEGCPGSTNPNNDKVGTYALVEGSAYLDATQKIDRYFAEIIKAKQDYIGTPSVTSGSTTTPASGTLYPRKESAEQDKKQHEADLAAEKAETTPDPAEIARLEKLIEDDNVAIMAAQEAIDDANEELKELQAKQKSYEDNLKVAATGSEAQKAYQAIVDEVVKAGEAALVAQHEEHKIQDAIKLIGINSFEDNGSVGTIGSGTSATPDVIANSEYDIIYKLYSDATTVENQILQLEEEIAQTKQRIADTGAVVVDVIVDVYDPISGNIYQLKVGQYVVSANQTAEQYKALIQIEIDNIKAELAAYEKRAEMYKAELEALIGNIDEEETPAA